MFLRLHRDQWSLDTQNVGNISRNLGWLLASRGVNAFLSLVYLAIATRILGLEGFGQFSLIVVLAQAITGIASFNSWQAVVRWGLEEGKAKAATGFAFALDLISIAGGAVFAIFVVWFAFGWMPLPPDLRWPALLLCFAMMCAIRSTPTGVLRLYQRYDLASRADAVLPAVRVIGAIIAALIQPDIMGLIIAWGVAELCCTAAFWKYASGQLMINRTDISLTALPSRHPGVWSFMLGTSLSRTLAVFSKQGALILVGIFGGASLAGGYRVASQLGQALVQLGEALSRAIYPEFVRTKDAATLLSGKITMLCLMTGTVAVSAAFWGGTWAISILAGPEFTFAHSAMVILSLAGAMELLAANWEALIVARQRAIIPFILRVMPLVSALALLPYLISRVGLEGAAFAILLSSILSVIGLGAAARWPWRKGKNQT